MNLLVFLILEFQQGLVFSDSVPCQPAHSNNAALFPNIEDRYFDPAIALGSVSYPSSASLYVHISTNEARDFCQGLVTSLHLCYNISHASSLSTSSLFKFLLFSNSSQHQLTVTTSFLITSSTLSSHKCRSVWSNGTEQQRVCCGQVNLTNEKQFPITHSVAYGIEITNHDVRPLLLKQPLSEGYQIKQFQVRGSIGKTFQVHEEQRVHSLLLLRFVVDETGMKSAINETGMKSAISSAVYIVIGIVLLVFMLAYIAFVVYCLRRKFRVKAMHRENKNKNLKKKRKRKRRPLKHQHNSDGASSKLSSHNTSHLRSHDSLSVEQNQCYNCVSIGTEVNPSYIPTFRKDVGVETTPVMGSQSTTSRCGTAINQGGSIVSDMDETCAHYETITNSPGHLVTVSKHSSCSTLV